MAARRSPFPHEHDPEIVVNIGIGRVEAQGFEKLLDCRIDLPALGEGAAELVVGPHQVLPRLRVIGLKPNPRWRNG